MPDIKSPYQVLKDFEQEFIHAIQRSIEENDRFARGQLFQSVKAQTKIYGQKVVMEVSMLEYWKYVEEGRRKGAKMPPIDAMLNFIRDRGIKVTDKKAPKKSKQTLEKKRRSLAFVLGRSISKKGITPTHFLKEALEGGVVDDFKRELFKSLGREIQIEISNGNTD